MKQNISKIIIVVAPLVALFLLNYNINVQGESYLGYFSIAIIYILALIFVSDKNKILPLEKVHSKRYYIALALFVFLVFFKFHGSSIGMWDELYKDYGDSKVETTIYLGKARSIRSDEWLVQTPHYLSQVMKENKFTRINENIRSDGEDMILTSYSPVLDATILGKPFNWGFLFLDKERGFSWYWCMKVIALFMLSYEMALMLSKRNKKISFLGAILISLAPAAQWWFSTFVLDLIIFGEGTIVAIYYYFRNIDKIKYKILNLVLFTICGIGFVITLYPPTQVCLGYLCLILFIHLVLKNKDKIKKQDIIYFLVSVITIVAVIIYFLITGREAISLIMNTVYPGSRVEVGGNYPLSYISNYVISWLLPYKQIPYLNACEVSSFISVIPLTLILFFFRKKDDEDNNLIFSLWIYMIIMLLFIIVGFPTILAKITLFSFVQPNRMMLILGLTSIYLIIMLLARLDEKKLNIVVSALITIVSIGIIFLPLYRTEVYEYLTKRGTLIAASAFTILIYLIIRRHINVLISYALILMVIVGFFVNPIARTLDPIFGKELSKKIISINESEPGKWVSLENKFSYNFLIANGVQTFNGIHYYPDFNMWHILDPTGTYENIYNRYAHVKVSLTNEKTSFELLVADTIQLNLSMDDFDKTGIKYLVSNDSLEEYNTETKTNFKELYYNTVDDTYIYEYVG